jgi:hypothetical protein
VEILNASAGIDYSGTWPTARDFIVRQGDVWIGISSKPVTANTLKKMNSTRYAQLNWKNPRARNETCDDPSSVALYQMAGGANSPIRHASSPDTEDGLLWDMLAQLGRELKGPEREKILPGFREAHLFMTGISQSGTAIRTWINGFHMSHRLSDGRPIYDGYLPEVGPTLYRINQCSPDIGLDDPRNQIALIDSPVINMPSEGDLWLAAHTRQPDVVRKNSGIITYEVAGSTHGSGPLSPQPIVPMSVALEKFRAMGGDSVGLNMPDGAYQNDLSRWPLVRGALRNLQLWSNRGIRPPVAGFIALDNDGKVRRDELGNAIGGMRSPYVDVPLAGYSGATGSVGIGVVLGTKIPLQPETFRKLYGSREGYLLKFDADVEKMVAGRWLLSDDGALMKSDIRLDPLLEKFGGPK